MLQFETEVKQVTCLGQTNGLSELWRVRTLGKNGRKKEEIFDAVIVGTGLVNLNFD